MCHKSVVLNSLNKVAPYCNCLVSKLGLTQNDAKAFVDNELRTLMPSLPSYEVLYHNVSSKQKQKARAPLCVRLDFDDE